MIMVDLIEEDFTSRSFDNIKALHSLVKEIESHIAQARRQSVTDEDYIVNHLDAFF